MNIYVGNLPYTVESTELREAFEKHGEVISAEVIIDRRSNRSRGYGFVEMTDADGSAAIGALNGTEFQGRTLRVDESRPKSEKTSERSSNQKDQGRRSRQQQEQNTPEPGGIRGFIRKLFG